IKRSPHVPVEQADAEPDISILLKKKKPRKCQQNQQKNKLTHADKKPDKNAQKCMKEMVAKHTLLMCAKLLKTNVNLLMLTLLKRLRILNNFPSYRVKG